jgi:hypothetical protein
MSDFIRVQTFEYPPNVCATCLTHQGPGVALRDFDQFGMFMLCDSCLKVAARLIDMHDEEVVRELTIERREFMEQANELEKILAHERETQMKVVAVDALGPYLEKAFATVEGREPPKVTRKARA